jgi:uncharacterized membrane protein
MGKDRTELEDLVGGRLLAWVGGLAIALGVVFMLSVAISRGWLGPIDRTVLAGGFSALLLTAGVWAHRRRGRTDASLAAVAAGIAGLFATSIVAGNLYDLVPPLVALAGSVAVGAYATSLAVRWRAPGIAALGVLGALASPVLMGVWGADAPVAGLFVATASATGVLLWQRWRFLSLGAYLIATPQWVAYLVDAQPSRPVVLAVLTGFGLLAAAAAVGFTIRSRAETLELHAVALLAVNALLLALVGAGLLGDLTDLWLAVLGAAHIGVAVAGRRSTRVPADLALIGLILGVVLADVAAARVLDGLPLVATWVGTGAVMALLVRGARPGAEQRAALSGLGGHLALALCQTYLMTTPEALGTGTIDIVTQVALVLVAAGAAISYRLAEDGRSGIRMALDAFALAVLAYVSAASLSGPPLTLSFAVEAMALALLVRRFPGDPVAAAGAFLFAGLTVGHALVLAPPAALIGGVADPLAGAAALAAAAVAVGVYSTAVERAWVVPARAAAAVLVLYAASVELVTVLPAQQGQAALSALWALAGVVTLLAGLARDVPVLRQGALALLAITVTKVFAYDLASLDSLARVASLIALGLLLLAGAFAWQRFRPRPLPDLRSMPEALR